MWQLSEARLVIYMFMRFFRFQMRLLFIKRKYLLMKMGLLVIKKYYYWLRDLVTVSLTENRLAECHLVREIEFGTIG